MKTVIIGNSGSGKTWLANKFAATGVTIIHLDNLFWLPGGFDKKRSKNEVDQLIDKSKKQDSWIVEGVFGELAEQYFDEADLLIWLDTPWHLCHSRLLQRGSESKRHMEREQSETGLHKLIEWASHYYDRTDLRSHSGHQSLFSSFHGRKVQLRSEEDVDIFVDDVQQGEVEITRTVATEADKELARTMFPTLKQSSPQDFYESLFNPDFPKNGLKIVILTIKLLSFSFSLP